MLYQSFYDPEKSYADNFQDGPFGAFRDPKIYLTEGEPKFSFFTHKVHSPFGIPAGPLLNGNFVQSALNKGFDICTYKTLRTRKYASHPWPNVLSVNIDGDLTLEKAAGKLVADQNYHEPLSITNSFGVPSFDPSFWQQDLARVVREARPGQIVVGSFQGTKVGDGNVDAYIEDFRLGAKLLKETKVKVMEVNLSCPNEGTANLLCFDTERSLKVVDAIKKEIGDTPLIIKIGYFVDHEALKNFIKEISPLIEGIEAINTIAAEIVDKDGKQALPGEGRLQSGVCGHSIKWAGLNMVKRLERLREDQDKKYTIIGVGGVMNPEDFREYQEAGAHIVMSATGAMWNPYLARDIKKQSLKLNVYEK